MTQTSSKKWRAKSLMIGIALISFIPFALAWYYARHPELISSRSNYGQLIIPPPQINLAELASKSAGLGRPPNDLQGHWVLLQSSQTPCDAVCMDVLHKTHQVRLMLNKEIPRVKRLLLVPEGSGKSITTPAPSTDDEDLMVTEMTAPVAEAITRTVGNNPHGNQVILIDPNGFLVMWYISNFDPYGLLKDLKHLLKASQIG